MDHFIRFGLPNLSRIGLGTGRFGTLVPESLAFEMLERFLDKGGTVIDTARNYYEWVENGRGVSERTLGKWMSYADSRKRVVICTKGGVRNEGSTFVSDLSESNLCKEVRESQDALGTERLDIYLLHRDEPSRPIEEIAESLMKIRELTACSAIGVSNWTLDRIRELDCYCDKVRLPKIDIVQIWWSIAEPTGEMWNDPTVTWMNAAMYQYLKDTDRLVMASTSQSKGFFQKAIKKGLDSVNAKLKQRIASKENLQRLNTIRDYCEKTGISPTAVVNAYIIRNGLPGIALVSCSSLEQLDDILDHADEAVDEGWLRQFDP